MGKPIALLALAVLLTLALAAPAVPWRGFTVLTEEFPPYNFTQDGTVRGISTDILVKTLLAAGFPAEAERFQVLPWARAYNQTLHNPGALLYSVTRTPERESLFKWVGPIAPNRNVLIARKDRRLVLKSLKDAHRLRVGAIREDAGEQLLLARGFPAGQIDLASDARTNLLKLDSGRIDLFAYPETVFKWVARQEGRNCDDYETVFVLHDGYVYFALNKETPGEIAHALQKALDGLKESGEVQAVIDRYVN